MKKILIVGDIHYGSKCTIQKYVEYQIKEFKNAISYAKENGIEHMVFLGDMFDNRKFIYIETFQIVQKLFSELQNDTNITFYIIVGNHDAFYKNTNKLNSPREIFRKLDPNRFIVIDSEIIEIIEDNKRFLFIPWMSKDNFEYSLEQIQNSAADYCFGHFEINNFVMNNNNKCKSSLKENHFSSFKKVFSGHFHTKSSKKNILYTGSLCQIDWSDYGVEKGFYVLDTELNDVTFIKSENEIFKKIIIGDKFNFDNVKNIYDSFLKIYINRKLSTKENVLLGNLISNNISYELIDNTILENVENLDIDMNDDFGTIVKACIEGQELISSEDKKAVISMLNEYYFEMKQMEK